MDYFLPDALTIAFCLTLLVIALGMIIQKETPIQMIIYWYDGFWGFLTFTLQMSIMLVFGSVIATSSIVKNMLEKIFIKINTPLKALYAIMFITAILNFFNWAIGIITGPVLTLIAKKRIPEINVSHLIAATYSMYVIVFPISISGTTSLLVKSPGHFLEEKIGIVPFSQTIFAPNALLTGIISFIALLLFFHFIVVKEKTEHVSEQTFQEETAISEEFTNERNTFAGRLNNSKILTSILCLCACLAIFYNILNNKPVDFNFINFVLLFTGLAIYRSPVKYMNAIKNNMTLISGMILQFPLYSGIMAMISSSGLVITLINWITTFATTESFPFWIIVSSSLTNFFIPANGGQWLIVGSLLTTVGDSLDVPIGTVINAFNFGTFSSNFLQPFWALPALAMSGLKIKDIWSYCLIAFVIFFSITLLCFWILPNSW